MKENKKEICYLTPKMQHMNMYYTKTWQVMSKNLDT